MHVLRNAMMPVITFLGMIIAETIAGSIVVEQVFGLPGVGRLLISSIASRDFPVVAILVLYITSVVIIVYCMVDIANLVSINQAYTREVGDEVIKMFTAYLKEVFGKTSAEFIYNGNGSFVILAKDTDYITVEDIMRLFQLRLDDREEYKDIRIEYKVGIAETFKENHTARKLLSEAIKSKKEYVSEPLKKEVVTE